MAFQREIFSISLSLPKLSQVIPDFMNWINCLIKEVSLATRMQHFPGMDTGMEIRQNRLIGDFFEGK